MQSVAGVPRKWGRHRFQVFSMGDDEGAEECAFDAAWADATGDLPPEAPPAPKEFSAEDLLLREALVGFYSVHRPDNVANVNKIVAKYRGRGASTLWASLCLKYDVPAHEAVGLLGSTLYTSAPFEYADEGKAARLEEALAGIQAKAGPGADRAELLRRAVQLGAED
ncbi:unnamed protein product, partial [Prorocentrum cordatum]